LIKQDDNKSDCSYLLPCRANRMTVEVAHISRAAAHTTGTATANAAGMSLSTVIRGRNNLGVMKAPAADASVLCTVYYYTHIHELSKLP